MIFPYVRHLVDVSAAIPSGEVARPEIPIRIFGPNGFIEAWGLVDTGADQVILPILLAEVLGVEIDVDETEGVQGPGGEELTMWPGEAELELEDDGRPYRWKVHVGIIESRDDLASAYLGHAGFLEYLRATFDGDTQTVELIPTTRFESIAMRDDG